MAISPLELRHIVECGFLPMQCRCSIDERGFLSIALVDPASGRNLVAGSISVAELSTSRAIANFIAELKTKVASSSDANIRNTA
jgi:hypothetical protein